LRAEHRQVQDHRHGARTGHQSVSTVGRRLRLMCIVAAAASAVLGALALGALATGGPVSSGLLAGMVALALIAAAIGAVAASQVQNQLVHPIESLCYSMRELAAGNRDVHVPYEERQDE